MLAFALRRPPLQVKRQDQLPLEVTAGPIWPVFACLWGCRILALGDRHSRIRVGTERRFTFSGCQPKDAVAKVSSVCHHSQVIERRNGSVSLHTSKKAQRHAAVVHRSGNLTQFVDTKKSRLTGLLRHSTYQSYDTSPRNACRFSDRHLRLPVPGSGPAAFTTVVITG